MVLGSPGQPHYSSKTLSYNGVHLTILNLEPLPHSLNFLASFIHSCGPTIALPVLDYPRERWEIPEDKRGPWVHGRGTMCWYNNTCIHTPPPTSLHSHSGCLHSHRPPLTWSKSVNVPLSKIHLFSIMDGVFILLTLYSSTTSSTPSQQNTDPPSHFSSMPSLRFVSLW